MKRPTDFVDVVVTAKEMVPLKELRATVGMTDWAWLAGVIDGEGSIMIVRANRTNFAPRLMVSNTDVPFLDNVQRITDCGRIQLASKPTPTQRPVYKWVCDNWDDITRIVAGIMPYLIIKETQGTVVQLLCADKGKGNTAYREALYGMNKRLNRNG